MRIGDGIYHSSLLVHDSHEHGVVAAYRHILEEIVTREAAIVVSLACDVCFVSMVVLHG